MPMSASSPSVHTNSAVHISSSEKLPAQKRYSEWLQSNLEGLNITAPNLQQKTNFKGYITSLITGGGELHLAKLDSFLAKRELTHIKTDQGHNKLALLYVQQGRLQTHYHGGNHASAQAGDFLIFDASQPSTLQCDAAQFVQLNLPLTLYRQVPMAFARSNHFVRAMQNVALSRVLKTQLNDCGQQLLALPHKQHAAYLDIIETLAVRVLQAVYGQLPPHEVVASKSLYAMAINFIQLNLNDAKLNANLVAQALACSRSTLYKAFAIQGEGIAEFIRKQRLQRLAALLSNPKFDHTPIADLAFACGLHEASNVSRLFKQHYALTPSEYRQQQQENHSAKQN